MLFRGFFLILVSFFFVSVVLTPLSAKEDVLRPAPEMATGMNYKSSASGQNMMVVSAHPLATRAGYDILKKGGSAADAAIAVQLVLGMVEPQSSGLGGGGFALYYDAQSKQLVTLDGRETAPSNVGKHLFMGAEGRPLRFYDASIGGRAVGTPGLLRMMEKLHQWYGKVAWGDLFPPAIEVSEKGFTVSDRLHRQLLKERGRFEADVDAKLYFYPDVNNPLRVGDVLSNQAYASTLKKIAMNGADYFYEGALAQDVVAKVRDLPKNRGALSVEDMAGYKAKEREAVCGNYRSYKVCSMGQPSSGGLTLLMMLGILDHFDLRSLGATNPESWHLISEASRLAFADRNQYMADPDFVKTPNLDLLDGTYLKIRAESISSEGALLEVTAGVPPNWSEEQKNAPDDSIKPPGTTHITIVDGEGSIISMTSSIENSFGARLMVNGFLLNNQLTDFSFKPYDKEGNLVANSVLGNKRPRSSMAPTIIFDASGNPVMALGSAGGSRIIGFVLQRIIAVLDWDMDIQSALDMPSILHRGNKLEVETIGLDYAEPLKNLGHPISVGEMNSGLTAIHFADGQIYGAADPRRDGTAMGE